MITPSDKLIDELKMWVAVLKILQERSVDNQHQISWVKLRIRMIIPSTGFE